MSKDVKTNDATGQPSITMTPSVTAKLTISGGNESSSPLCAKEKFYEHLSRLAPLVVGRMLNLEAQKIQSVRVNVRWVNATADKTRGETLMVPHGSSLDQLKTLLKQESIYLKEEEQKGMDLDQMVIVDDNYCRLLPSFVFFSGTGCRGNQVDLYFADDGEAVQQLQWRPIVNCL